MNIPERPRIKYGDVLAYWQSELCRRGLYLRIADCDQREQWFAECRQLLEAVPDHAQRMAWQIQFVAALAIGTPGLMADEVMAKLQVQP